MGQTRPPKPVMLVVAISSRYESTFAWALERMEQLWGPLWLIGERFEFAHTDFYKRTMGEDVLKQVFAYQSLIDPGDLPGIKLATNEIEETYNATHDHDWPRPLNIDPGYITEAKLVLATVKNRDHRVYIGNGIYGEVTLSYYNRCWNASRWTYPDYMTAENRLFFTKCRDELRRQMHEQVD